MQKLITILGPTATGKTKLAAHLADQIGGEIISADSRQVYRGMDIGTGKDTEDYFIDGKESPYHLVDIVDPGYEYNVFEFQKDIRTALEQIEKRKKRAILCGGSGLYIDAILRGYALINVPENKQLRVELAKLSDEILVEKLRTYGKLHNTTDTTDSSRTIRAIEICEYEKTHPQCISGKIEVDSVNFGIHFERSVLRERITERLKTRLESGMIQEVERLLNEGLKPDQLIFYGLEYRFVTQYVTSEFSYDEMFQKLNTAIHQFSKRQMTWYRRMEKKGVIIHWINGDLSMEEKLSVIYEYLNKNRVLL